MFSTKAQIEDNAIHAGGFLDALAGLMASSFLYDVKKGSCLKKTNTANS